MERKREDAPPGLPELLIEKAALGESSTVEKQRLATLDAPQLAARLRELKDDDAAILARYPAAPFAAQVAAQAAREQRQLTRTTPRWLPITALGACGAAGLLALLLVGAPHLGRSGSSASSGSEQLDDDGATRTKGQRPQLLLYRLEAGQPKRLADGASGQAGDLLQLAYVAAGQPAGVLLSIDGRGGVTLHWPATADSATTLAPRGVTMLDRSFRLDDAPDFERFFFITASDGKALSVGRLLERAHQLAQDKAQARTALLPLPKELHQSTLLIAKH